MVKYDPPSYNKFFILNLVVQLTLIVGIIIYSVSFIRFIQIYMHIWVNRINETL
jgi:hypothetical protein